MLENLEEECFCGVKFPVHRLEETPGSLDMVLDSLSHSFLDDFGDNALVWGGVLVFHVSFWDKGALDKRFDICSLEQQWGSTFWQRQVDQRCYSWQENIETVLQHSRDGIMVARFARGSHDNLANLLYRCWGEVVKSCSIHTWRSVLRCWDVHEVGGGCIDIPSTRNAGLWSSHQTWLSRRQTSPWTSVSYKGE